MSNGRLNIRLPKGALDDLQERAEAGGFASRCMLARCLLMQFVRYSKEQRKRNALIADDWLDDFTQTDRNDPTRRKAINERL